MAKIWQKMKKSLVHLAVNPFPPQYCGYPKPGFWVPVPLLYMQAQYTLATTELYSQYFKLMTTAYWQNDY